MSRNNSVSCTWKASVSWCLLAASLLYFVFVDLNCVSGGKLQAALSIALFLIILSSVCVGFREVKVTEVKPKEVQLSVERVPGTLSTASKSVQVNGAATVSLQHFSSFVVGCCLTSCKTSDKLVLG